MKSFCILFLATVLCCFAAIAGERDRVTVKPVETNELFANPGMGWQTFHTFADQDPNLEGLPSGSAYFRFYWRYLELKEGEINYALLDSLLTRAHKAGQKLALRVMCVGTDSQYVYVPNWLKDKGCPGFDFTRSEDKTKRWVPDMDSPIFREAHFRFIEALGKRYDGHPDLDLIDIGTVGLWGEWHMSGTGVKMPSSEFLRTVIDTYLRAFPKTPKVMLIGGEEGMTYAVGKGCGWRADCLGDMGGFSKTWNHMENFYPQAVEKASAADAWKIAPVAFESCWTMQKWAEEHWSIPDIFDYGLDYHASYLNNKSSKIPSGTRPIIENFLRRIGYRLVLRTLEYPRTVQQGKPLEVTMIWENTGVAPPYRPNPLAFRLVDTQGECTIIPAGITIQGWLPGSREVSMAPIFPKRLKKGNYTLSLAVLDQDGGEPAVRLAISGRASDGWYPMGKIKVK